MLFGFGVAALCDHGVCPVSMKTDIVRFQDCPAQRNLELLKVLTIMRSFVQDNFYGSLVLSKYLGILIAACVQILYGPNNPGRIIKQNKVPLLVQKSRTIDIEFVRSFLDELLYKSPKVASEIISLQLPKGTSKPPLWLLAVTNDLMRLQVLRPNGVLSVARQLFEHYGNILPYEDQEFCDKVSTVILAPPRTKPEEYVTNIIEQVSVLLQDLSDLKLRQQFLRLYKNLVHKFTADHAELAFNIYWTKIFEPCITWTADSDHVSSGSQTLLSEREAFLWLNRLETIANLGLLQNNLSEKLNTEFLRPLLFLYHHVYRGISPQKSTLLIVIKELAGSSASWSLPVFEFLSADLAKNRNVFWGNGESGGFLLRTQSELPRSANPGISLDPNDILGSNDKIVEVTIKILKSLPPGRDDQLSDFFHDLFRDVISSVSEPERAGNFLDGPADLHQFQVSLRKGLLLELLCQTFGQKLLKNTTQTIALLKLIIVQKSENPSMEKDELLTISFGILSTYMRDEIELTESDKTEIKSLLEPLNHINKTSGNNEIANLANDLRICIATKVNVESLPTLLKQDSANTASEAVSLPDIIKDLGDPLIPSRAHAIIQLGKQFAAKNPVVMENVELLQKILLENLTHNDSYVFLAAVKCLGQISWCNTQTILDRITGEILNASRKEDDRAKCMEVLVNIVKITNEMLPRYESQIFNCLLKCVGHQESEIMRVSSLGCLGDLCKVCRYGILCHIQEIIDVCERTLVEDQSLLAKKGAIVVIANFIESQDKTLFHELERETLRIYRLLKKVVALQCDEEVQHRALQALGVLSGVVREFMFPKTRIQHEIKIL